jgi:hypothetical protein
MYLAQWILSLLTEVYLRIRSKIYKEDLKGLLSLVGSGECTVYSPVPKNPTIEEYVSLNFGQLRVHLNKKDFTEFCKKYLAKNLTEEVKLLKKGE